MSLELVYTSAPCGLLPGRNGYCTVAMTEGLPNSWRERLEALSSYARHFPPDDPRKPPVIQDYMETYVLASDKCFLSFPPA